jgi:membrane-bound serine protease (ClpP class)
VIDYVAQDLEDLLLQANGREVTLSSGKKVRLKTDGVTLSRVSMSLRQRILDVLINPNIAYILMMLGFYGLLFKITHPGVWFPGVAGLICMILAFYAFHTLPTNYAGLALIILAMALFIAEVFVTSYGLLSIVGVISMLLGSLFLVDSTAEFMQISLRLIIPIVLATGFLFVFLVSLAMRAQRRVSPVGLQALIGSVTEVSSGDKAEMGGEIWDLLSEQPLQRGDRVQVTAIEGMKLRVKKIN